MLNKPYKKIGNISLYGNNHLIPILFHGFDLSPKQQKEVDYLEDLGNFSGFIYKNNVYDFSQFSNALPVFQNEVDYYLNDTYFSGIAIKLVKDDYGSIEYIKAYTFFVQ